MALDDTAPIDETIKMIDKLKFSFKDTVDSIAKDSERLGGEYGMLVTEAKKLAKELSAVNVDLKEAPKTIEETTKATDKLAESVAKNTEAQKQNEKAMENVAKASNDLTKAKDSLLKGQATELNSMEALKKQLDAATKAYYAMGDATDQAVKDEQLKKVAELNTQYTNTKKVLDAAKKSTTEAAGSYNELNARVIAAKKELKAMEGGLDGNSKEFKKLQKEVKDGTKQLKEWDAEIGDNQRNVGDYKNQIAQLVPGFGNVTGAVEQTSKSLWALAANPVGAVLLAIVGVLSLLAAFFTQTEDGGDALGLILSEIGAIVTLLMDQLAGLGRALWNALSEPQELFKTITAYASTFAHEVKKMFEDPLPAIKAFGQFLVDQLVNRITGVIDVFKNLGEAMYSLFTGNFDQFKESLGGLANAALQVATGIEDLGTKIVDAFTNSALNDLVKRAKQIGKEIFDLKDSLEDQLAALILTRAQTELKVNELILKSKDKLKESDEDRYRAIRQVSKESERLLAIELDAAQKKVAIAQKEIELKRLSMEASQVPTKYYEELNKAEAELLGLRAQRLKEQKRLQQQEIAIIREIEGEMLAKAKREYDAETNLAKVRADIRAKELQAVIADSRNSLEVRNAALMEAADKQIEQAQITADQQMQVTKEAALARIELDADTLSEIYNNEALTVAQRIDLEREMKEAKLAEDQAYVNENARISEQLVATTTDINNKMIEAVTKNVFTQLQDDFNELENDLNAGSANLLRGLNDQLKAGTITYAEFERQRKEITANTNKQILEDQLDFLAQKANLLRKDGQDTSAIDNQIAQVRLKLSAATVEELIQFEKDLASAKQELQQVAKDTAISIGNSQFEAEQQALALRMEQLTQWKENELALAGDNEARKAEVLNEFARKEDEIRNRQNEQARKQAIFNKAAAVFEIGVSTAKGIAAQLPGFPLTAPIMAIIGAIGALQIAAVLAKPIPAFAVGTDNAPGGLAIINELGPEIIEDRSGNMRIINTDGPTFANIEKGSKVYTARETQQMLNGPMAEEMMLSMQGDTRELTVISEQRHDKELARIFSQGFESLEYTMKRTKTKTPSASELRQAFAEALKASDYKNSFR